MPANTLKPDWITRLRAACDAIIAAEALADEVLKDNTAAAIVDSIADVGDPVFASGVHGGLSKAEVSNAVYALSEFLSYAETHKSNLRKVRS